MPFQCKVLVEEELGYVEASSDISILESVEAVADLFGQPEFQPHFGVIVDFLQVQKTPPVKELKKIAETISQYKGKFQSRIGLIVNPKEVTKASIVCMLVRPFGVRMEAYENFEDAKAFVEAKRTWPTK